MQSQNYLISFVIIFHNSVHCNSYSNLPTDYYWRDYAGIIPDDAFPGGFDRDGQPTYIGQAFLKEGALLPATIIRGSEKVRVLGMGKEFLVDSYIKILCTRNFDKLMWVPVKSEEIALLTDCHLIIAGTEVPYPLYIGRVNHNGKTVIGKVFSLLAPYKGIWILHQGGQVNYATFEILTYNCNLTNNCKSRALIVP